MEIILKQDIPKLGNKDDILDVKTGYATNYLIPQGMAIRATATAKKILAENKRQQAHKEERFRAEALEIAKKLEGTKLTIGAKTSSKGKIFGSVTNIQIAEELEKIGFNIDRKKIFFDSVKEIGEYKATISLFKDIKSEIDFEVISE
ncbi:MAG: 50S ribosomal protein L9 [Bacteroidales bacterium]|nr:50S ribosomal protein L9 [Bacteroidales bacterium]